MLDHFMPDFDFGNRHAIVVPASRTRVYAALDRYRLGDSRVVRVLFRLRGLAAPGTFRKSLASIGFVILDEKPGDEVVFGTIAGFGRNSPLLAPARSPDPADFAKARPDRSVKIAANFRLEALSNERTLLTTETRVKPTDRTAYALFALYWTAIKPFSGLIRRIMLRGIRRCALAA
jgi:hypothetical protein